MTATDKQESGTGSHGSCENNDVSLFELLESFPDKETVKTTHLQLCKSVVPGKRFSDAARSLAFNEVKNGFILSTDKANRLRTSGGFISIKDPSDIFSIPTTAFASFYPKEFEDPIIEKIPDESVIPSGEKKIKVPSFDVLLTCANEMEVKLVLEARSKWKESLAVRNFVVVSPLIVSSIASLDHSASAVTALAETINTIRDLNLTSKDDNGKLQKPITKLIVFLIARAVDEMDSDDDNAMLSVDLDATSNEEQIEYKKSINKLFLNQPKNKNNEPDQTETPTNKKRDRASTAKDDDDDDEENNSITDDRNGRKRSLSITSLQDEKDLAFLGMIQQLQNNMASKERSSTKSRSKWENWTETSKATLLALLSKDYHEVPTTATSRIQDILLLPSGGAAVDLFKDQMPELDCDPDKAMFHSFKIGKLVGHNVDVTSIVGPSIFSCPVQLARGESAYTDTRLEFASMGVNTDNLSKEEIKSLTVQKLNLAKDLSELNVMVENFVGVWSFLLERDDNETSMFVIQLKELNSHMRRGAANIRNLFADHGQTFLNSIMVTIHRRTTAFIRKLSTEGIKGAQRGLGLSYEDIFEAISEGTFMNRFQVIMPNSEGNKNSNGYNNQNNQGNQSNGRNNNNRNNFNSQGWNGNANGGRGNFQQQNLDDPNPNINETRWNQRFNQVFCPDTMKMVATKGKFVPTIKGVNLCLKYHAKGACSKGCTRAVTHVKLHGNTKKAYDDFSHAIHDAAHELGRIKLNTGKN